MNEELIEALRGEVAHFPFSDLQNVLLGLIGVIEDQQRRIDRRSPDRPPFPELIKGFSLD